MTLSSVDVIVSYIAVGVDVNRVCSAYIHDRVMLERRMPIASKSAAAKPDLTSLDLTSLHRHCRQAETPVRPSSAARGKALSPWRSQARTDRRGAQLAEEGGAEAVSVREAARRAGVSPGAPFRHFPSRDALMTAVAEEAQRRFRAEIDMAPCAPRRPTIRWRGFAASASPICAGRCATPPISRSFRAAGCSITTARPGCRGTMPS